MCCCRCHRSAPPPAAAAAAAAGGAPQPAAGGAGAPRQPGQQAAPTPPSAAAAGPGARAALQQALRGAAAAAAQPPRSPAAPGAQLLPQARPLQTLPTCPRWARRCRCCCLAAAAGTCDAAHQPAQPARAWPQLSRLPCRCRPAAAPLARCLPRGRRWPCCCLPLTTGAGAAPAAHAAAPRPRVIARPCRQTKARMLVNEQARRRAEEYAQDVAGTGMQVAHSAMPEAVSTPTPLSSPELLHAGLQRRQLLLSPHLSQGSKGSGAVQCAGRREQRRGPLKCKQQEAQAPLASPYHNSQTTANQPHPPSPAASAPSALPSAAGGPWLPPAAAGRPSAGRTLQWTRRGGGQAAQQFNLTTGHPQLQVGCG